jgi:hypothetical protein
MHQLPARLNKELEMIAKLPPPRLAAENFDLLSLVCVCGKRRIISDQQIIDTGVVRVPDSLCPDCKKEVGDYSHIVCVRCKRVVASCKPHRETDGFVYERGRYYHTRDCPVCSEELRKAQTKVAIVEKHIFRKKLGLPV